MALRDIAYAEVRMRQQKDFVGSPNFVQAGEDLIDGDFVIYDTNGEFSVCPQYGRATHFVLRSGAKRHTIQEIADNYDADTGIGRTNEGEPVMAYTGHGIVCLPIQGDIEKGDRLVVSSTGFAKKWDEITPATAYMLGYAVETVDADAYGIAWADCQINLPAHYNS